MPVEKPTRRRIIASRERNNQTMQDEEINHKYSRQKNKYQIRIVSSRSAPSKEKTDGDFHPDEIA